ncbi:MAG TPA: hypothetical protein G4O20_05950 [Dehalococcoidia bacterium]|nr:hypothetical protein [Dehalococcoidia bacterium]
MAQITKEIAEACEDICDFPEGETVVVFSIQGRRTPSCGIKCEDCPRYSECFPRMPECNREAWIGLMNELMTDGEVEDEG